MENKQDNNLLIDIKELKNIIEAILFTYGKDVEIKELIRIIKDGLKVTLGEENPEYEMTCEFINKKNIEQALEELSTAYKNEDGHAVKGVELVHTALGYRFQAQVKYKNYLQCLTVEKPPKYSKAVLETLAIVAYRQPITRAEIEAIRGVAVSSEVVKKLLDREWVQVIGHKEVPGRPAVYATTKLFLSDLGLERLEDLPVFTKDEDAEQEIIENLENKIIVDVKSESEFNPEAKKEASKT